MPLQLERLTAEALAVTVADMKEHSRVDGDWEDGKFEAMGYAVQDVLEGSTGIAMTPGTYRQSWDRWPECQVLRPSRSPITTVTTLEYLDDADQWVEIPASDYRVDLVSRPARVYPAPGTSFPSPRSQSFGGIRLTFDAGVTPAPQKVRQAILMGVDSAFEFRGDLTELNLSDNPIMRHYIASFGVPEFH